ncbi:MAG: 23S rRNA pseudouridine(1911/1915/1917) synthase RluD [Thiomargarita sp.]|nr:23S rRNA pseudouridine(1911/1915/1917) synthase RluD [Thiomargarita sp.]
MEQLHTKVPPDLAGYRLDKILAILFPSYSRTRLQKWIRDGQVLVDNKPVRGKDKLIGGEEIKLIAHHDENITWQAQNLPLDLLYEDEDVLVINKPAGLVVHPGTGNQDNTLVNSLLHHIPELKKLPRAGIVHRLDKHTSGVLVVARSLPAHTYLVSQLQKHRFKREYNAIVVGVLISGGTIDAPIGRHPIHRTKMAIVEKGKPAITHYRISKRYRHHTLLRVQLETGRTHQIRVHFAYKRYPIIGDPVYGSRLKIPPASSDLFKETLRTFSRQALHATTLGFEHPNGKWIEHTVPIPDDMKNLLAVLEQDKNEHI